MVNFSLIFVLCSVLNAQRVQYNHIIAEVNQVKAGWTAELISDIDYDDEVSLIKRLGAILISDDQARKEINGNFDLNPANDFPNEIKTVSLLSRNRPRQLQTAVVSAYPESLDLRIKYPGCTTISLIRNQGTCGSCWAFATINALTDRWCISTDPKTNIQRYFSVEDVLECCDDCNAGSGNGCRGGIPSFAYKHARDIGLVSGDLVSVTGGKCKPYFLDIAKRFSNIAPACSNECTNPTSYNVPYNSDLTKITSYSLGKGEDSMIAALNNGGTVAISMTVYQDLYSYKSGIYKYVTGRILGGHSVRLIGYGVENGEDYWLMANTWGTYWGENGFFRMRRGTNECNIETSYHTYALP
jgi:cathepsin B